MALLQTPQIDVADLPEAVRTGNTSAPISTPPTGTRAVALDLPAGKVNGKEFVEQRFDEMWRDLLVTKLAEALGNVTQAARLLNITRKTLQTKMKELGLREPPGNAEDDVRE